MLLLEREHFPRFHIGESLLPYNHQLFREMGVMPALESAGFIRKYGAQFHLGNGAKGTKFVFSQGRFTREPEAIQVERATFDHLLLKHARSSGAEVREGWTVGKFTNEGNRISMDANSDAGESGSFRGSFLIDASGRGNVTGNQEGLRVIHPRLKKLAVFGHFTGVRVDEGDRGGDTIIVRLANKWFWLIPISREKVSVGCVIDQEEFASRKQPPEEIFTQIWQSSADMRERMRDAKLAGPIRATTDFSYHNRRFVGPRRLRVGGRVVSWTPSFPVCKRFPGHVLRQAGGAGSGSIAGRAGRRHAAAAGIRKAGAFSHEFLLGNGRKFLYDALHGAFSGTTREIQPGFGRQRRARGRVGRRLAHALADAPVLLDCETPAPLAARAADFV